jgi:hypothetical protein
VYQIVHHGESLVNVELLHPSVDNLCQLHIQVFRILAV